MYLKNKRLIGKLAALFFVGMVLFTLLSRAVYQNGVAVVSTAAPAGGTVAHTVTATGKIVQNQVLAVNTVAGLRVGSILVNEGQEVAQGDVLLTLDQEYLEEVILPNTLETIGNYAFYECSALDKIWIDQNVTSIGNEAFGNCTRLTIHGVEGSYAEEYAAANSIPFSAEIMVYPTGSIEGSVIDAAGDGVQGVTVTFYDMTKGDVQETLITDENGEWSSNSVYIGHTYRVRFYHTDYEIAENVREYLIGEEAIVAEPITAVKKDSVAETDINDFTYTVLNGTYCQITGYTGTAAKISIPSQINGYIVQSLGNNVFSGNMILTTVVFPESIETMGSKRWDPMCSMAAPA